MRLYLKGYHARLILRSVSHKHRGDVPGVVVAAVVRAFELQPSSAIACGNPISLGNLRETAKSVFAFRWLGPNG